MINYENSLICYCYPPRYMDSAILFLFSKLTTLHRTSRNLLNNMRTVTKNDHNYNELFLLLHRQFHDENFIKEKRRKRGKKSKETQKID